MAKISLTWRSWLAYAAQSKTGGQNAKYLYDCTHELSASPSDTRAKLHKFYARDFLTSERLSVLLDMVDDLAASWRKHDGVNFIDCDGPGWRPLIGGGHQKIDHRANSDTL